MGVTTSQHELLARESQRFFEERWREGDPWEVDSSELDQASYESQAALLRDRTYGKALELGCGSGAFTRRLAEVADRTLAIDVAPSAIERARATGLDPDAVQFAVANIMDFDLRAEGPWDLVVMSETIYYLGWLYPLFGGGGLATEIFAATRDGGRFLMANTYGGEKDYLLRPWLIDTYRSLFLNVGYRPEAEEVVVGTKDGVDYQVLVALFSKPAQGATR
jgi:SAM-dependent methyltransferase